MVESDTFLLSKLLSIDSILGYFVVMFLYKSKKINIEVIAQKVSSDFSETCR